MQIYVGVQNLIVSYDKSFNVYLYLVQYDIYFARHFIFYYLHSRYAARANNNENKMTRKNVNIYVHGLFSNFFSRFLLHVSVKENLKEMYLRPPSAECLVLELDPVLRNGNSNT